MMRKGEIYITDLGKKSSHNIAKKHPFIVFQNDRLNRAVDESIYKDVVVIPLSTKIVPGSYRLTISPRQQLQSAGDAVCNALCTIAYESIDTQAGAIAILTSEEILRIEAILLDLFGIDIG